MLAHSCGEQGSTLQLQCSHGSGFSCGKQTLGPQASIVATVGSVVGAHVSAGEESAREPTSVIHFLGTQGISLRVCGAENPSQGPWEPGALGAALILGGLETAGGALQLPFPSL